MGNNDLISFLLKANKSGYADPNAEIKNNDYDNSHEIIYRDGDWVFMDYYYGGNPFSGQENIIYKKKTVWAMQYRGGMVEGFEGMTNDTFEFLKKALMLCDRNEPVRGPKEFCDGDWRYENDWTHDIAEFRGNEKIWYGGQLVHEVNYFGGSVDMESQI